MAVRMNRFAVVLLIITAFVYLTSCVNPLHVKTNQPTAGPGIGMIEHRGQFYRVENLMNPDKRSKSSDRFMRDFGNDPVYASPWAGMNPEENRTHRRASGNAGRFDPIHELTHISSQMPKTPPRSLEPFPWAGRNPEDLHD